MYIDSFILIALIIFFASFTQGMTGFGFALISVPLVGILAGVKYAIPLAAICGLVVNIYLILKLKNHVKFLDLQELLISAIFGIPLGAAFVIYTDQVILKKILGVIVLIFVFLSIFKIVKQNGIQKKWGYLFGFASGLLGGAFNTNGPPILIYFYLQGYDKIKQKASITGFFIITSTTVVVTHLVLGLSNSVIWMDAIKLFPVVLIGIILGQILFNKISTQLYNVLILFGLFIISLFLLFN